MTASIITDNNRVAKHPKLNGKGWGFTGMVHLLCLGDVVPFDRYSKKLRN